MSSAGKGIAIVCFGLGIAGLLVAPAASQTKREKEAVERKLDKLWRLYPLDPEEGRKGQRAGTRSDAPAPASPFPANDGESGGRGEVTPDDEVSSRPSPLAIAITLGCVGALLLILSIRRTLRSVAPTHATSRSIESVSEAHPASETAPTQVVADLTAQMRPELRLVRVHLKDGRRVEGAVKLVATQDSPVLLLDVVDVTDAEGRKRDPEPFEAFVPLVEVARIETIDDMHERDATEKLQWARSGTTRPHLQTSAAEGSSASETAEGEGT